MNWLVELTLRASAILATGLIATLICRKQSAAVRHWILSIAVVLAALTPLINILGPSWHLAPPPSEPLQPVAVQLVELSPIDTSIAMPMASIPAQVNAHTAESVSLGLWIGGMTFCLIAVVVGSIRLARLAASARPLINDAWNQIAGGISREYRLSRSVRLLQSPNPSILATWGILKPKVVLPAGAESWTEDRARVVLSHELAHIRRRDWIIQILAEVLRAIYWFNPLVWIVCNRLRLESEYACDDAALHRGIPSTDYAAHLLELARDLNTPNRAWSAALAMARPSTVERRFQAMLNPSLSRRPVTRLAIAATLMTAIAIAIPIVTFSSTVIEQVANSRLAGTVSDASGAPVRSATVIVSTPDGRTEVTTTTNPSGKFAFANLPAGIHVVQVFATGFGPSRIMNIELKAGEQFTQDVRMDIGFVATQEARPTVARPVPVPIVPPNPPLPAPPAAQESGVGSLSGQVSDPSGAVVPGVSVTVTMPSGLTRETVTNEAGVYSFSNLGMGPARLVVSLPGFKTMNMGITVTSGEVGSMANARLSIAPMAEELTIMSTAGSSGITPAYGDAPTCSTPEPPPVVTPVDQPVIDNRTTNGPKRIRQGGNVGPASLLSQTRPIYPNDAKAMGVQGAVIMEVIVGRNGRAINHKLISGNPILAESAWQAVSRWCYRPTLLNGEPVEVVSTVTMNFVLQ